MSAGTLAAIRGLSKSFGGTRALAGLSLDVQAGEVHGLVGQNGSGKSTLIKLLSGYHAPDAGSVEVAGHRVRLPASRRELRELGVEFVHQDLGLVDTMSVLENLRVGRFATGVGRRILWRRERALATELLRRFDVDLDPGMPVGLLSQTQRAIVAIMRALHDVEEHRGSGLLVLDEPTAALPAHEIHHLFDAVRRIAEAGSAVLFVTHNLDEVFEIADRVTVLRDGALVATRPTAELDEQALIELIVGRALGDVYPPREGTVASTAMEARGLRGAVVSGVSFDAREGEILGLTGLVGAGHEEVPYLVYGARRTVSGTVALDGEILNHPTPRRAQRSGIVLLPADRQRESAILGATVKENVTMPVLGTFRGRLGLDHRRERSTVQAVLDRFDVRPPEPERPMLTLSGGNQQKALLGRSLHMEPRLLLLHEPTQGVDVGARQGIFQILKAAARRGTSIVYASVEYEDLANVCDRVLVFRRGRIAAELAGAGLTHEAILRHCYQTGGAS